VPYSQNRPDAPLQGLPKLHLIADQHDVLRADADRHHIRERDLAGFADEHNHDR
jgi:hypothetical protein